MTTSIAAIAQSLAEGLHRAPAGTFIPRGTPLAEINGTTGSVNVRPRGFNFDSTVPRLDGDWGCYVETKFWEPNPLDEDDKSDRVLVAGKSSYHADGTIMARVIWNEHQHQWVWLGLANEAHYTLADVQEMTLCSIEFAADHEEDK